MLCVILKTLKFSKFFSKILNYQSLLNVNIGLTYLNLRSVKYPLFNIMECIFLKSIRNNSCIYNRLKMFRSQQTKLL